jgi:hypothetical protein
MQAGFDQEIPSHAEAIFTPFQTPSEHYANFKNTFSKLFGKN